MDTEDSFRLMEGETALGWLVVLIIAAAVFL